MVNLNNIVLTVVALLILFVLFSSLILTYFRNVYTTYGYCLANSTGVVACADCNNTDTTSVGYGTLKDQCYSTIRTNFTALTDDVPSQNNTHCWGCGDWGFRATARGLFMLIFSLALVGFGIAFLFAQRKKLA